MNNPDNGYTVHAQFDKKRFLFHANAVAAAGQIDRIGKAPASLISPVHGQSSLSTIGGISRSSEQGSLARFAEFFQYGLCETLTEGKMIEDQDGERAEMVLRASVSDVRVRNSPSERERPGVISVEFQAERLALDIKSVYPRGKEVAFQLMEVSSDHMWIVIETAKEIRRVEISLEIDPRPFEEPQTEPLNGGVALRSIVSHVTRGGDTIPGHVLVEKGLGTIYFGEVVVSEYSRRLTMVRIEMGSINGGRISLAAVDPNGVWPGT